MRLIIFRGKSLLNESKWLYGFLTFINEYMYITPGNFNRKCWCNYKVWFDTICQFTGYKDVIGNDIYEDDIVSVSFIEKEVNMRVLFLQGGWKLQEKYNDTLHDLCSLMEYVDVKVIGNMFDTPELLRYDGE